jgi:peptide/nickel transport system permease protein
LAAVQGYVLRRFVALVPTALGVSLLVFLLMHLIPGTVVDQVIGTETRVTEEGRQAIRAFFGLDQPLHVQYLRWVGGVLHADFGQSWRSGLPISSMILDRLGVTLELGGGALLVALLVGLPLGTLSAVWENRPFDHAARIASLFSLSVPIFWQAAMLLLLLSLQFHWVPPAEFMPFARDPLANVEQMALPVIVLGTGVAAQVMRMTRSTLLDVLRQDYVRTARAKGATEWLVLRRHAFANALIPILTVVGVQVGYLLGGAVVTEQVFTLPGVGRLVLEAVQSRDYPLVQGTILSIALLFMLTNLLTDLLYAYVDPRVKYR